MDGFFRMIGAGLAIGASVAACSGNDTSGGANSAAGSSATGSTANGGSMSTGGQGGSIETSTGTSGSGGARAGGGGSAPTDSGAERGAEEAGPLDAARETQAEEAGTVDAAPEAQAPYNPCPPAGTPCIILPLGDSITWGDGETGAVDCSFGCGGYRAALFHLALLHQQKITFVGNTMVGPDMVDNVAFPKGQEGHPGFTIDDGGGRSGIHSLTAPAMMKFHPNIVTLMIGTNDIDAQLDLADAPRRLGGGPNDAGMPSLIDTIFNIDPNVLLVVAQLVPTTDDTQNVRVRAYNSAIPSIVKTHADAGKHIIMVDMYDAFTANANYKTEYMSDKLHPTKAGYAKMADVWYAAIGSLFR